METLAQQVVTASPSDRITTMFGFVAWEEVFVSSDKGRREVHYYLKREDGSSDLAVIGKERSLRHMSYAYAIRNRALVSTGPFSSLPKLKSRRDVIEWLDSIVSDLQHSHQSDCFLDVKDVYQWDTKSSKDIQLRNSGQHTREFSWLGSPWTCRKRRKHFQSFCRNGIEISVYDFVYVLAEEDQRLVAYLEDMYEDSRGSKMVVVRWFHKIDEVDIALPRHFNDREIFFSLCLQDLSIECIDGLAVVLSPQHFEKFLSEAISTKLEPYLCRKQFDNDDVKPFDITQVKGYWKQEILRYMYTVPSLKADGASEQSDGADDEETENNLCVRAKKRRLLSDDDMNHDSKKWKDRASHQLQCLSSSVTDDEGRTGASNQNGSVSARILATKETQQKSPLYLAVDSQVEVLSQDSGIRGCWFRAKIIKKHKDKIKIQYQDLQDADDESNKLVEWISATRVTAPDHLGLRFSRRPTIRPPLLSDKGIVALKLGIGSVVDVWWHGGWWEGIVVQRESEDKLQVHFPGEKKESTFGLSDLRLSREWLGSGWMDIKERPDIAATLSSVDKQIVEGVICDTSQSRKYESTYKISCLDAGYDNEKGFCMVPDLSKDNSLSKLKWSSSRKRSHINVITFQKPHFDIKRSRSIFPSRTKESFFISPPLKVEHENCKQIEEFPFCSSVVAPLTSLVMSRWSLALLPFHLFIFLPIFLPALLLPRQLNLIDLIKHGPKDATPFLFSDSLSLSRSRVFPLLILLSTVALLVQPKKAPVGAGSRNSKGLPFQSLASVESLSVPLFQEVVLSADIQCAECERRIANTMSTMMETESVLIHVFKKQITLADIRVLQNNLLCNSVPSTGFFALPSDELGRTVESSFCK